MEFTQNFFRVYQFKSTELGKEHKIYFSVGVSLFITMHFLIECPISVPLDPRESVLDRYVVLEQLVLWEKQMKATWLEDSKWVDSTLSCEGCVGKYLNTQ